MFSLLGEKIWLSGLAIFSISLAGLLVILFSPSSPYYGTDATAKVIKVPMNIHGKYRVVKGGLR
jgi:hypothetical protein